MLEDKDTKFVFRLQNESNGQHDLGNTLKHWDESCIFDDKQINAIESSNVHSEHEPTSIPSPFARIALAKTAFGEVAEHGENALASYQKIVSDSLDVAEIFFTFENWEDDFEIIKWDGKTDLEKLSQHIILHKTLKTFLENDAEIYNFDKLQGIYILKHKNTGSMIGATSPCTLFFSSANKVAVKIPLSNNHSAFDDIFPLHKRNWDFQKYLYTWIEANNENRVVENKPVSIFNEFVKYLKAQKPLTGKIEEIDNYLPQNFSDYEELRAPDVEILSKPLHKSKNTPPTPNDFFQDKIIRLPYKIQKSSFFDGNLNETSKYSYLIPVTDIFFKYYSVDDLQKWIRINEVGTIVEVQLKIPGLQQEIKKIYKESESIIKVERDFDCAIFPNVKFKSDEKAHFRFGLVCDFDEKENFNIEFVKINENIDQSKKRLSVRNETYNSNKQLKNYLLFNSNFDYIKLLYKENYGIIIPKMKPEKGNQEFTFAVDFGTTNTHIEYKIDYGTEQTFDIVQNGDKDDRQVHWLYGGEDELKYVFDEEYIPAYTDGEFHFPMRSILSYGENTNWNDVYPFEKAGLAVLYEKRLGYDYNTIPLEGLKWSDNEFNQKQVQCYIESIMYLLRNKVLLNNGNLEKTKIKWFYPVSMGKNRYNNLKNAWGKSYNKYFGNNNNNIISIAESIAPFEYYVKDGNADNLVTIDIGGGTTDIVIAKGRTVNAITSFRFAANTIFGDGFSENRRVKNGIVRQFLNVIRTDLKSKIDENDTVFKIFNQMEKNKSSADIASFLFSLKDNKRVKQAGSNLANNANLSSKLANDNSQKITFIFFYAAIIYHLAKIMKAKILPMPDKIVFSGNGSRVIQFFTDDTDILKGFTKLLFKKVYEQKEYEADDLEIILNKENPKEATCKGGFYADRPESFGEIIRKKVVLHSTDNKTIITLVREDLESVQKSDSYNAVNADYLNETVEEVKKFIQLVFDLLPFFANEEYKLNNDSIRIAKAVCFQKLDIYAKNGWELKKKEVTDNEVIEESLFFYPLIGMIKALGDAICDKNKSNINN